MRKIELQIGQEAPQDIVIFSGLLNHFRWVDPNKKTAGWIYLARAENDNGNTKYRSVLAQVYGNTARMLENKYKAIQNAKQMGEKPFAIIQLYSAMITSWTPQQVEGKPKPSPVVYVKGFKGAILDRDRIVEDYSENPIWNEPQNNQHQKMSRPQSFSGEGGFKPQQDNKDDIPF